MSHFIEVSHPIEPGMKTYPGLPEPRVEVLMDFEQSRTRYATGTEFFIASLHLCGNTGTYVDSPFHRYHYGVDLAGLPLEKLAHLPVEVIDRSEIWDAALAGHLCADGVSRARRSSFIPAGRNTGVRIAISSPTLF
jgi:kynurenine formamidase